MDERSGNQTPANGDSQFAQMYATPELQKLLPVLYPNIFPNLAAVNQPRADLVAILLTGIPSGIVPGFQNFTGATASGHAPSEHGGAAVFLAESDRLDWRRRGCTSYKPDDAAGALKDGTTPSPTSPFLPNFPY